MAGSYLYSKSVCECFENSLGLGGKTTINQRINVLATRGYIRFLKEPALYGLPSLSRSKYGYLCVEGMSLPPQADPDTGEITGEERPIMPTHYKCSQSGNLLEMTASEGWFNAGEEEE